jgi:hypothetical protein
MFKLRNLLFEFMTEATAGEVGQGNYYDWTRDFDVFKTTINNSTEAAKTKFEKALMAKIKNRSVLVRASKGYKQPVKDYTIKRVTAVNINDFYDDWVVVLKNEFNKEYFLISGYKIKILGMAVAKEPGAASAPQEPTPAPQEPAKPAPQPTPAPAVQPQKPVGE